LQEEKREGRKEEPVVPQGIQLLHPNPLLTVLLLQAGGIYLGPGAHGLPISLGMG